MTLYCFPRLQKGNAKLWTERFSRLTPEKIAALRPVSSVDGISYAPTGGPKVPPDLLKKLREQVLDLAKAGGYPHTRTMEGQRCFDLEVARLLFELPIIPGEAWRDEVWQFISCRLIPEVVAWRFGKLDDGAFTGATGEERFLAGNRNTFQRLWLRATILRDQTADDEFWLLDITRSGITEDNFAQLIERPGMSTYRNVSRLLAVEFAQFREFASTTSELSPEDLMREVAKRVFRVMAFANLDAISEEQRLKIIRSFFVEVIESHGGSVPTPGRVYDCFAPRTLRPIDLPHSASNQHEIQGVRSLRDLLGDEEKRLECHWRSYWTDGSVREETTTNVKWYDARASHATRTEWRLYYPGATPMEHAKEGDMLLLATCLDDENLHAFLLPRGAPIYLRIRGAIESEQDSKVSDDTEKYIRDLLHQRL